MRPSLRFAAGLLALAPLFACAAHRAGAADAPKAEAEWTPLFNGKDLSGWTMKVKGSALGENPRDTVRVEDGMIRMCYDQYPNFNGMFGHLFWNEKLPAHYRLRIEYRFTGKQTPGGPGWAYRNSGVMVMSQEPKTMGKDQDFPVSIEVQLLGGDAKGERSTLNMCSPGTNIVHEGKLYTPHTLNSKSRTCRGDDWVKAEIEVDHGKVSCFLDGPNGLEKVHEYEQCQLDPNDGDAKKLLEAGAPKMLSDGWICLQAESHPCDFRKVELKKFDK